MQAAAGLAIAALLAGCGGAEETEARSVLRYAPDLEEGFAALPRVDLDTPQARAINAALDRIDVRDRGNREDCLKSRTDNDNVDWRRSVAAPMAGPRFVAVVTAQGGYCGGAHGNSTRVPLVFDLETGRLVDWRTWLPAEMATSIRDEDADRWGQAAYLTAPALKAWFAERALAELDHYTREFCARVYVENLNDDWGLVVWPDAKAGGLRFRTAGLAYAGQGCETEIVMPMRELKRRGVSPVLADALQAAHRARFWRGAPPEKEGPQ